MTEEQFYEVVKWQKETFPKATVHSKIEHLKQEISELQIQVDLPSFNNEMEYEFADCFLLLFGAASAAGMDYEKICTAIESKMAINKKRKWGKPDANGVVNHIK